MESKFKKTPPLLTSNFGFSLFLKSRVPALASFLLSLSSMLATYPVQVHLFDKDHPVVPLSSKRAFMSKENRLYQEGPGGGNKRLRPTLGNERHKLVVSSSSDMFAGPGVSYSGNWLEDRENIAVPRSPRLNAPLVRSTPSTLWQITPKENTDPRIETCSKKSGPMPIGFERRNLSFNTNKSNMQKVPDSEPQPESFTWAGAGPESSMDLLTSPLPLMTQRSIAKPVAKPLRSTLGPHRHSFTDTFPSHSSHYNYLFSPSSAFHSLPESRRVIDQEPLESRPMSISEFASVMRDIRRKNPFASKMPSMLNPLRARAPFMYQNCIEPNTKNPYSNLTWNFQKRRSIIRSRSACAESNRNLRELVYVSNGDCHHCTLCKRDSLCKRLLVAHYWHLQDQAEEATEVQSVPRDVGDSSDEEQDEDGDVRMGGELRLASRARYANMDVDLGGPTDPDVLDITGSLAQELRHARTLTRPFDDKRDGRDRVFLDQRNDDRDRRVVKPKFAGVELNIGAPFRRVDGGEEEWVPDSPMIKDLDSFPEEEDEAWGML